MLDYIKIERRLTSDLIGFRKAHYLATLYVIKKDCF
jgi:hypothetical protein